VVVARDWHSPTPYILRSIAWIFLWSTLAFLVALAPVGSELAAMMYVEPARWVLAGVLFLLSLPPLVRFLFLARLNSGFRTFKALAGERARGESSAPPPFTPSGTRRFLSWRWRRGALPSAQVWEFSKPIRSGPSAGRDRVVLFLAATTTEQEMPVRAAQDRLRQWMRRQAR
jgi:hypothetical protein